MCVLAVKVASGWSTEAVLGPRLSDEDGLREPWAEPVCLGQAWRSPLELSHNRRSHKARGAATENSAGNSGGAKRREETPAHSLSCRLPRTFSVEIHLGWEMCTPPGGTCCQTKYGPSKTIGQRQPRKYPYRHKACRMAEQSSWFPYSTALHSGSPAQWNLFFVSMCVSSSNSSPGVKQESTLGPWKGAPFSAVVLPKQCEANSDHEPGIRRRVFLAWLCHCQMLSLGCSHVFMGPSFHICKMRALE